MRSALLVVLVGVSSCATAHVAESGAFDQRQAAPALAATNDTKALPKIDGSMQGEPPASALAEARLVESSCKDDPNAIEADVRKMREEVNARFQEWVSGQPDCWREYRQLWLDQQAQARGGLGLWGVGEGGGAVGYGIGRGSIGTIGHGAGHASPRKARVASGTNNQIDGVDEADIVKTDGRYVYLAANGALRIVEAMNPKVLSVTKISGSVRDLFVAGDRAVVFASSAASRKRCTYGYDCEFAGDGTSTRIHLVDIEDRQHPKIVREIEFSGSLIASRRIDTTVHTVVSDGDSSETAYATWPYDLGMCGSKEAVVRAKVAALKLENEQKIRASARSLPTLRDNGVARPLCAGLLRTALNDGRAFTTIASFDLRSDTTPIKTAMIQSRPGAVFASSDALYLSVAHKKRGREPWYSFYSSVDEVSDVHKFRIGKEPSATRYVGSGVVPGRVLNQFAMDQWQGYLRIATSRGRVPDPDVSSSLSILSQNESGDLVRVGAIDRIAPGEDIRAVRFDGDRGYIVTFKKTDPLFVMDLAHPARPAILGELKIPGFSTYLHRIDPNHLLSIGFDADDQGDFAYFSGILLQLFDVRDPSKPKLLHKEKIGTRGSSSEAATNHLAFNYLAEKGKLAVPMTICEQGGDGAFGKELAFSGLLVYDVDLGRGFTRLGGIDHGKRGASCSTWWSNANSQVKRSVFLDDLVYSIAADRVKVQRLGRLGEDVADLAMTQ